MEKTTFERHGCEMHKWTIDLGDCTMKISPDCNKHFGGTVSKPDKFGRVVQYDLWINDKAKYSQRLNDLCTKHADASVQVKKDERGELRLRDHGPHPLFGFNVFSFGYMANEAKDRPGHGHEWSSNEASINAAFGTDLIKVVLDNAGWTFISRADMEAFLQKHCGETFGLIKIKTAFLDGPMWAIAEL